MLKIRKPITKIFLYVSFRELRYVFKGKLYNYTIFFQSSLTKATGQRCVLHFNKHTIKLSI